MREKNREGGRERRDSANREERERGRVRREREREKVT